MELDAEAGEMAAVAARRTTQLISLLRRPDVALHGPSLLPGWSRLTVVCHLRYGATALLRMSFDALAGREAAYYPSGRARQRPATLVPGRGERPGDVLDDWADAAGRLDRLWAGLSQDAWGVTVREPADNPDLGALPLAGLALARLTEIDVHGVDLDVGFPDWSTTLIDVALPARLARLQVRRSNHRQVDRRVQGTWLLAADDVRWVITVDGDRVVSRPAAACDGDGDERRARATITGTRRDLLALLLGRPRRQPLRIGGDREFGTAFERAFPGP